MILEYWLANMRTLSVVCATLVAIMIISGSLSFPVFAQTPGPPNPNANKTTAYTLLHQNETNIASTPPFAIKQIFHHIIREMQLSLVDMYDNYKTQRL